MSPNITLPSRGIVRLLAWLFVIFVGAQPLCANSAGAPPVAPIVLYTDILSGPNYGGENDKGIYLSIFGKNFGTGGLGSQVRIFINDVEVDNYRYLGPSKGRPDIQQITVQIGPIGNPMPGKPLPIRATVEGRNSNTDCVFTVASGQIYFVNNVNGVDTPDLTTGGTFDAPFRTVQRADGKSLRFTFAPAAVAGAWGRVQAGDFIVMRGTHKPWTDVGFGNYFFQALNKSGCAIGEYCAAGGSKSSGPISLIGFPGEDIFINNEYNKSNNYGAISSADSARIAQGMGAWISIANLRIEGGNHDGGINTQAGGNNWRVVNNEITAFSAIANRGAKAGGIAGNASGPSKGPGNIFLGNHIHDVYNGPDDGSSRFENHGIYIDGPGQYAIGFNLIRNIRGGNGFLIYANGSNGPPYVDDVYFHHNHIENVGKHGINLADGSRKRIRVVNNVIYRSDVAGLRLNSEILSESVLFNNTIVDVDRLERRGIRAALMNDSELHRDSIQIRNNIFVAGGSNRNYVGGSTGFSAVASTTSNNLWSNGKNCLSSILGRKECIFGSNNIFSDPATIFESSDTANFRLKRESAAIDAGSSVALDFVLTDFDALRKRPQGQRVDIGAFEYNR